MGLTVCECSITLGEDPKFPVVTLNRAFLTRREDRSKPVCTEVSRRL